MSTIAPAGSTENTIRRCVGISFPPSALTEYKVGDRVTVQLGLAKLPVTTEATSPEPSTGTVGAVPGTSDSVPKGSLGGPAKP
jgi:hypothetical protein